MHGGPLVEATRLRFDSKLSRNRHPNMTQNEHVCAIFCRPDVAGDVISGENVKTIKGYVVLNFEAAGISRFRANQHQPFV